MPLGCSSLVDRLIARPILSGSYLDRAALKVYVSRGRVPKEAVHRPKEVLYRAHDEAIAIVDKAIATHEEAKRKRQLRRCPQATKLGYMRICTLGWLCKR